MTLKEFLINKNIIILGYGKQGKATYNYIRKNFKNKKITIADESSSIDVNGLDENTNLKLGKNYLKGIENFDLIIKSPGVSLKGIDTSKFKDKIITDYELFLKFGKGIKIGITGTKGKSTTSTFLYEVIKNQGKKAVLLGNIGIPIFEKFDEIDDETISVIEVSSHTLEFVKTSPNIAVLLDIYPEHLDHCNTLEEYISAKFNIAKFQNKQDVFLYNAENELMKKWKFEYKKQDIAIFLNGENSLNFKSAKNKVYLKNNRNIF